MSKKTKKNTQKCDHYLFCLKPQQNYCKFSQTISVSFCDSSKHRRQKQSSEFNEKDCLECPVFNKDNNFATPTFILHSQKQHFCLQGQKMRTQHEKKMIEYTDEKDSLNLPKPRSKNSFCNVCRQTYEDYLSHIQGDNHKKCINNSNFNRFILELVDKFNPSQKSTLNFTQNTHSTQDDDDVEILYCKPKKKVKTLEQAPVMPHQATINHQILPPPHLNFAHTTYFPNNYQGFMPNQCYNFLYPFNNFPTVQINFNDQQIVQNQVNYPYQNPNFGFMNPWSDCMAQYQRNLMPFQSMNQPNPVIQQNFNQFNSFITNPQNQSLRNTQQKQMQLQQNGFEERRIWEEQKNRQFKMKGLQNVDQLNIYLNGR